MILAYLHIRKKQLQRSSHDIGLMRLLLIIGLCSILTTVIYIQAAQNSLWIAAGWTIIVLSYQLSRKDKLFLQSHLDRYQILLSSEYSIASLPILLSLALHWQFYALAIVVISNLLIPFVTYQPKSSNLNTPLQRLIPNDAYEWKAFGRKHILWLFPVWCMALATSFYTPVIPIAIFLISLLTLGIYEMGEPLQMILAFEKKPSQFLQHKLKRNTNIYLAIITPLLVAFCLFYPDLWYIAIAEVIIFTLLHLYTTTLKYAFYQPNKTSATNNIFIAIGTITTIIPIFSPVLIALTMKFYFKSIQNLKNYL